MAHPPKITKEKRQAFLNTLANTGNVSKACLANDISRTNIYNARRKNKTFAEQWDQAAEIAKGLLEDEAWRRAMGIEKAVIKNGEPVLDKDGNPIFVKQYSDHLLTVLLNGNFPDKYRYNSKVDANISGDLVVKIVKFADAGNNDTK